MALFGDSLKRHARKLMDPMTLVHGGVETPTQGVYTPAFRSPLDPKALPSRPVVTGFGGDFPGVIEGDTLIVGTATLKITQIEHDAATDDITLHLRPA